MEDVDCNESEPLALRHVELLKNSCSADPLIVSIDEIEYRFEGDKRDKHDFDLNCRLFSKTQTLTSA